MGMIFMKSKEHKPISRLAPKSKSLTAISTLAATGDDIELVVVLMLENRSFDNPRGSMK
jgi:phospholipase C